MGCTLSNKRWSALGTLQRASIDFSAGRYTVKLRGVDMKLFSELPISLDRMSTREELEEVWNLLTDPYTPENGGITVAKTLADPRLTDWRADLARIGNEPMEEDQDQSPKPHEKHLMDLLHQIDKLTN